VHARPRTVPRKRPRQARSLATVDAILEATAHILVRDGYDRASTNRVATAAGVSIGSLYQYFPSKESLVAALVDRHCEQMLGVLAESAARYASAPLGEAIRAGVAAQIRAHRVDPHLHRVLIEQVPRLGRLDRLAQLNRRAAEMVRSYLEAHREEVRDMDLDTAAFIVVTTVEALCHAVVLDHPERLAEAKLTDEIADVAIRYLRREDAPGQHRGLALVRGS
jgi:AcrR family transcriptional regulator